MNNLLGRIIIDFNDINYVVLMISVFIAALLLAALLLILKRYKK